jgi:diadenosine tetraphosphate (Ap4A) HIT family hydrolase
MSTPSRSPHDCPFCRNNNLLKVPVIAEAETAYLVEAYGSPGCYLIVPSDHAEAPADMPDIWWRDVKTLLSHVPSLTTDYNLSFNIGKIAGQTVNHMHFWVIPREAGQPSTGLGLAALISNANQE